MTAEERLAYIQGLKANLYAQIVSAVASMGPGLSVMLVIADAETDSAVCTGHNIADMDTALLRLCMEDLDMGVCMAKYFDRLAAIADNYSTQEDVQGQAGTSPNIL